MIVMKPMRLAAGFAAVVVVSAVAGCAGNSPNAEAPQKQAGASGPGAGPCATGGGVAGTCVIGDTGPGGGKVFYVNDANPTGSRYMEAPPNTWNGGPQDPRLDWATALAAAENYTGGRKKWVLPSKDQLNELYVQRGIVGGFAVDFYWSSSQDDASNAWVQDFYRDFQTTNDKNKALPVRPVRAF